MKNNKQCAIHILFIFCLAALGMTMLLIDNTSINKMGYLTLGAGFIYGWYLWIMTMKSLRDQQN
ncbi:MAG: hypothetical protein D8M58_04155 [Calditrichaeota bacterium]|nr:MAG: hypothetical protein DWQ03_02920 [Calditrichota bacterium]MBL1204562.1 hypothetical protein [Calditrichota bacterium]NOG44391.1 hypothetical protein [Calditrichota bacterium]